MEPKYKGTEAEGKENWVQVKKIAKKCNKKKTKVRSMKQASRKVFGQFAYICYWGSSEVRRGKKGN